LITFDVDADAEDIGEHGIAPRELSTLTAQCRRQRMVTMVMPCAL